MSARVVLSDLLPQAAAAKARDAADAALPRWARVLVVAVATPLVAISPALGLVAGLLLIWQLQSSASDQQTQAEIRPTLLP